MLDLLLLLLGELCLDEIAQSPTNAECNLPKLLEKFWTVSLRVDTTSSLAISCFFIACALCSKSKAQREILGITTQGVL